MRIAIISDTHFGDAGSKLVRDGVAPKDYRSIQAFDALCEFLNPNGDQPVDFLVLNGDTLDFSINSFEEACKAARPFFQAVADPAINLAKQIVVIPGNHDKEIWDVVEWERHITRKMQNCEDPEAFTRTQPAIIRYADDDIDLPGVSKRKDGTYGGLFLKGLFTKDGPSAPIIVAYPNLYIQTTDDTYMVTHGHMLEPAWVLLSELLGDHLRGDQPLTLQELEEFNIPLTALVCSGVGQAGDVTKLFYAIQVEAKSGKVDTLRRILNHVIPKLDDLIETHRLLEWSDNVFLWALKRIGLSVAAEAEGARYDKRFLEHTPVRQRFARFYRGSVEQARGSLGLPAPDKVIFGHTHEPIEANSPMVVRQDELPWLAFSSVVTAACGSAPAAA